MEAKEQPRDDARVARALGLKVPVYRHMRAALERGEDPLWLRSADPVLAGTFPNAFGFELLLERFEIEEGLERRRANLMRAIAGKEENGEDAASAAAEEARAATDEGELEDLALALEPSPAPDGFEPPGKAEHAAFLDGLRRRSDLARELRRIFRDKGMVSAEKLELPENEARPFKQFEGFEELLSTLAPAKYLGLRRGERAHALRLQFTPPAGEVRGLFDRLCADVPPQEKDSYFKLFADFVERERLPRLVQEARARLKRNAENAALQQAWSQLESALDRGRHEGAVLGACALRGGKLMLALLDNESRMLRSASLPARADDLPARVAELLGDDKPDLLAMQADSASRAAATKLQEALRAAGCKFRQALVPVAVVKTMLREVARRPDETHLSHDERQALLLARLAWSPRDAAFHTPHVVRAYIPFRGEINGRRLEQFERTFLQYLLGERGVDINEGSRDRLRLVPGLDVETVELERSTAPFRSLADLQARLGLTEPAWNAACCLLRVRNGDEQLDGRPLHPRYYEALQEALERTNLARTAAGEAALSIAEIMREPAKAAELDWEPSLEARGWRQAVVDHVRSRLGRPSRRPRPRRQTGRPANTGQRLETLEIGAKLPGKITSLVAYGAFVDVGVRREGLVHVSQMADRFVKDPADVVKVGQEVIARVVSVDVENQRFRLSLRSEEAELAAAAERSGGGGGGERGGGERGGGERGSGERGSGRGGRGGGRGDERGGERRSTNPAVRDTRPKGGRAGGKGRGDDRGKREKDIVVGRDPRGRTVEEIDPTNPFVQFFREHSDVLGGGAAKGGKKSGGKEKDASS